MFDGGTSIGRKPESFRYISLEAHHELRDLVSRLLSARGERTVPQTAGIFSALDTASGGTSTRAMKCPAINAYLSPVGSAALVLDRRGRLYLSQNDILYRLRFWTEDEWAALQLDGRPVGSIFDPDLDCWVALEPAPHLDY